MAQVATRIIQSLHKHVPLIKFRGKTLAQSRQPLPPPPPPPQANTAQNTPMQPSPLPKSSSATVRPPKRNPLTEEEIKIIEASFL
jgi:hypothetical protein